MKEAEAELESAPARLKEDKIKLQGDWNTACKRIMDTANAKIDALQESKRQKQEEVNKFNQLLEKAFTHVCK